MKQTCTFANCSLQLVDDPFYPPGAKRCPEHGGPIWVGAELQLAEGLGARRTDTRGPTPIAELDVFIAMLDRLSAEGGLRYSVSRDMAGEGPVVVTIENHGPDQIDVRFLFDLLSGSLTGIRCYSDKR